MEEAVVAAPMEMKMTIRWDNPRRRVRTHTPRRVYTPIPGVVKVTKPQPGYNG